MASTLINPRLFSKECSVPHAELDKTGLIDPIINCDTKLFVDPLLLSTSKNLKIKDEGYKLLKIRFEQIIRLVDASAAPNDKAWRTAAEKLDLSECPQTGLGYGGSGTSGSSRPEDLKQKILFTAKEILTLGEKDPEILSLMGLFEKGVGPDTISDLTTNIILPILCEITEEFCLANKVKTKLFPIHYNRQLPENPSKPGKAIILVPKDIVRELPLAADWADVSKVIMEISTIRSRFNDIIGDITKATVTEKKEALKRVALSSLSDFKKIFETVMGSSNYYDPNEDVLNFYCFRNLMAGDLTAFKTKVKPPVKQDGDELLRLVNEIISHFKIMVENNNLWEMLWNDNRPKRERASQLLFFAVADLFCKANNIDISPETNMGGGPVDFKFSSGYANRIVVEIKLSKGSVKHGYEKQLEIYKKASQTDIGIFVVMNVGLLKNKLKKIQGIQQERLRNGEQASQIVLINALPKVSASKNTDTLEAFFGQENASPINDAEEEDDYEEDYDEDDDAA